MSLARMKRNRASHWLLAGTVTLCALALGTCGSLIATRGRLPTPPYSEGDLGRPPPVLPPCRDRETEGIPCPSPPAPLNRAAIESWTVEYAQALAGLSPHLEALLSTECARSDQLRSMGWARDIQALAIAAWHRGDAEAAVVLLAHLAEQGLAWARAGRSVVGTLLGLVVLDESFLWLDAISSESGSLSVRSRTVAQSVLSEPIDLARGYIGEVVQAAQQLEELNQQTPVLERLLFDADASAGTIFAYQSECVVFARDRDAPRPVPPSFSLIDRAVNSVGVRVSESILFPCDRPIDDARERVDRVAAIATRLVQRSASFDIAWSAVPERIRAGGAVHSAPTGSGEANLQVADASEVPTQLAPEVDLDAFIQAQSPTSFVIDRGLLEHAASLANSTRVIPSEEPAGLRVYGVRPDSFFARIGLRNGDALVSMNGHSLDTPDAALSAYAAVRSAENVQLSIVRGGQPMQLDYTLRGPRNAAEPRPRPR